MKDSFGRSIDYMRISITDRCNLRCRYCMPDGVECLARREILTLEEIEAVAICAAGLGISRIKVTGGEPLVRRDCCQLVKMLKSIPGIEKVTITTNGVLLDRCLAPLLEAGIDGINISLDTLDPFLYKKITGFDCLGRVMETMELAAGQPVPVKINAVSIDFSSMDESGEPAAVSGSTGWKQMVDLTGRYPIDVRFIEMMPIGYGKQFKTMNHKDLLEEMYREYPGLEEDHRQHGYGPAVYYRIPGALGSVGLISAIHGKFCNDCNRIRLTSQGYLKTCLCYEDGTDLRAILREGMDMPEGEGHYRWPLKDCPDDEMLQKRLSYAMRQAIEHKPAAHCFERPGQITELHNMISIGG
ncbi:GTP 3',8-cyclase MoaA [Enterocloster citroniae]|uniref:GTP 3',8-cyclase MoaA n=1 Tax=Enterocloster citroniae TaxID=358743 RepID=UPI0032C1BA69